MHSTHWIIGCALGIASIGVAATTAGESQDMDSSAHATLSGGTVHDGGSATGSDVLGLVRDPRGSGVETPAETSGAGDRAGSVQTAPARVRQTHLGWQSLLPGSIQ